MAVTQNSKIFPGTKPRTFVLEEGGSLFLFSKNVLKLSYSNAEFKKFPGTILRTPVLGERKVCFRSPKCTKTLIQQCRIQNTPFLGMGGESCLLLKFYLTTSLITKPTMFYMNLLTNSRNQTTFQFHLNLTKRTERIYTKNISRKICERITSNMPYSGHFCSSLPPWPDNV